MWHRLDRLRVRFILWHDKPEHQLKYRIPETIADRIGRFACERLGWHGVSCRGRNDHTRPDQLTWHPLLRRFYL